MTISETPASFTERFVEADGFRIRTMEAGEGTPLVHLHGAGGLRMTRAHDLLARHYRVIVFEMPGFGRSPENTRSATMADLAATMATALTNMQIERFNLLGTSFGGKVALWLATQQPARVLGLVLEAPAAIRPPGQQPPSGSPEEMARLLFAHPEKLGPLPPADPAIQAKNRALASRLRGPDRDAALEARMRDLATPTLVLFGTLDRMMPPEHGPSLQGDDSQLPPSLSLRRGTRDEHRAARGVRRGNARFPRTPRGVRHQPHGNRDPSIIPRPRSGRGRGCEATRVRAIGSLRSTCYVLLVCQADGTGLAVSS